MGVRPIGSRREIVVVIPLYGLGPNVPQYGMPPGVRGMSGEVLGWQPVTVALTTGHIGFMGWVYPTEAEALAEARRIRTRMRSWWKSRGMARHG